MKGGVARARRLRVPTAWRAACGACSARCAITSPRPLPVRVRTTHFTSIIIISRQSTLIDFYIVLRRMNNNGSPRPSSGLLFTLHRSFYLSLNFGLLRVLSSFGLQAILMFAFRRFIMYKKCLIVLIGLSLIYCLKTRFLCMIFCFGSFIII